VPRPLDVPGVVLSAVGLLLLTFGFVDAADATAAVASFLRGFEFALVLAGAILVGAALLGFLGLRRLRR